MNPELSRQVAASRISEWREAAQRAPRRREARAPRATPRGPQAAPRAQLRSRVGFALVEAGLRLLAD